VPLAGRPLDADTEVSELISDVRSLDYPSKNRLTDGI
jgi:hypothetical protein